MAIIAPTIDSFDESTVMRMLRKLIGWIKNDLIEQINNNDINSVDKTVDGMSFSIDLVKGDGTKIPIGQITLDDSDNNVASGEFTFDTNNRKLSGVLTTGNGSEIEIPAVTIPAGTSDVDDFVSGSFKYSNNQLTLTLYRESGTNPLVVPPVTISGGGEPGTGNPYPTAISGTVTSTGEIQLSITMNEGSPLTGNIDMMYFASAEDLEDIQTQLTDIKISTTISQDSSNVIKVSNAVNGNSADLKLDLAIVGDEIVLTAENGDGTQQAVTKIAVGDIPFEPMDNVLFIDANLDSSKQLNILHTFNPKISVGTVNCTQYTDTINIIDSINYIIDTPGLYIATSVSKCLINLVSGDRIYMATAVNRTRETLDSNIANINVSGTKNTAFPDGKYEIYVTDISLEDSTGKRGKYGAIVGEEQYVELTINGQSYTIKGNIDISKFSFNSGTKTNVRNYISNMTLNGNMIRKVLE